MTGFYREGEHDLIWEPAGRAFNFFMWTILGIFIIAFLITPASANNNPTTPSWNKYYFQQENYQGPLYLNETVTKASFADANGWWGLGASTIGGWDNMAIYAGDNDGHPAPPNAQGTNMSALLNQAPTSVYSATWANPNNLVNGSYVGEVSNSATLGDIITYRWWIVYNIDPPIDFTGIPTSGAAPLTVRFNATRASGTWTFGDGMTTPGPGTNITHLYSLPGLYTVDFASGTENLTKNNYIQVFAPTNYTMAVSPSTINVGGTTTAIISSSSGSYDALNAFTIIASDELGGYVPITANGNEPSYVLSGTTWKQWSNATNSYSISLSGFPTTTPLSGFSTPGNITLEGTLFAKDNTPIPKMYATVTVTGNGQYFPVQINVKDPGGSYIYGATASLRNPDGTWNNQTVNNGAVSYSVQSGSHIGYTGSATGYNQASTYYTQITGPATFDIVLTKPGTHDAGMTGLNVLVRTASGGSWQALGGAMVQVQPGGVQRSTGEAGIAQFEVNQSATYSVTATKAGYQGLTRSVSVGTAETSLSMELAVQTVATPTVVPTVCDSTGCHDVTPVPTVDPRTDPEKDSDMMGLLRDAGPGLIGLCILVTMFSLIGMLTMKR